MLICTALTFGCKQRKQVVFVYLKNTFQRTCNNTGQELAVFNDAAAEPKAETYA